MKKLIALLLAVIAVLTVLVLSGISTPETMKTFAYRPTMVLDGVGDIVKLANGG